MLNGFRDLPSVERVLSQDPVRELVRSYSHESVVKLIRQELEEQRNSIREGNPPPTVDHLVQSLQHRAAKGWAVFPTHVINATGVILHTNLGRAPLSRASVNAVVQAAQGYTNLEFDINQGQRGSRQSHLSVLLSHITGAETGIAVNNNASMVMLGLAAVAAGKDVIISRSEAVEIGGGFRIPEVLAQSGTNLVEVGTTNRTYITDYEKALTENTGALLKIHPSNFRVVGFTHVPSVDELTQLGRKHNVPVLHDLGSGCLLDTTAYGLAHEPTPQESINAGVDLTFFSGDKLLGGPQAGIAIGQASYIRRLEHHPLARAIRLDKLGIAALTATLLHYVKGEATKSIPTWRMIAASLPALERRANRWQGYFGSAAKVVKGESTIGAGSLPGETLPTWLVSLKLPKGKGTADALATRLRESNPPVVGRIENDRVVLDPRTVLPNEDRLLTKVVLEAVTLS